MYTKIFNLRTLGFNSHRLHSVNYNVKLNSNYEKMENFGSNLILTSQKDSCVACKGHNSWYNAHILQILNFYAYKTL